ncbi:acid protease [Dentipellis sp. KUC8613]|nr:acid protease [Dentipellis sp. KUC8613]
MATSSNYTSLVARAPTPIALPLRIFGQDVSYISQIAIGASGKKFNVLADSGSAEFWVLSEESEQLGSHNGIGPKSSSTFHVDDENDKWGTEYEDEATVTGFIADDKLTIGGVSLDAMPFGVAETITGVLVQAFEDGIMGFAPSVHAVTNSPTPIEAFAEKSLIPARISGWRLSRLADGGRGGEVMLGGTNAAKFDASTLIEVANVDTTDHFWQVGVSTVKIDDQTVVPTALKATMDTGASDIRANPAVVEALLAKIPGEEEEEGGDFVLPCDTQSKLAFTIGGKEWNVDPRDLALDAGLDDNMCLSHISGDPDLAEDEIVLGATFLKNVYLSLNLDTNKIGLAEPK